MQDISVTVKGANTNSDVFNLAKVERKRALQDLTTAHLVSSYIRSLHLLIIPHHEKMHFQMKSTIS